MRGNVAEALLDIIAVPLAKRLENIPRSTKYPVPTPFAVL